MILICLQVIPGSSEELAWHSINLYSCNDIMSGWPRQRVKISSRTLFVEPLRITTEFIISKVGDLLLIQKHIGGSGQWARVSTRSA